MRIDLTDYGFENLFDKKKSENLLLNDGKKLISSELENKYIKQDLNVNSLISILTGDYSFGDKFNGNNKRN
jgi:hypothetical protein